MLLRAWIPGLVQDVVSCYVATGRPTVPEGRRDELVRALMSAAVGPATQDEYIALLEAAYAANNAEILRYPRDLPIDAVIEHGAGVLTDEELAFLALSDVAFGELCFLAHFALLHGTLGECWGDAIDDIEDPPGYREKSPEERQAEVERLKSLTEEDIRKRYRERYGMSDEEIDEEFRIQDEESRRMLDTE